MEMVIMNDIITAKTLADLFEPSARSAIWRSERGINRVRCQ
jgi:hypothetical protein